MCLSNMAQKSSDEDLYLGLENLIKSGNLKDALAGVEGKLLDSTKALRYVGAISLLAHKHIQNEEEFNASPEVVLSLTENLCSFVRLDAKNALRYLTSLYHIEKFFIEKNYLKQAISLFKIIVHVKKSNERAYEENATSLHKPFNSILSKTIMKEVNCSETDIKESNLRKLFSLLLNMLKADNVLNNGTAYLRTVQHVCQIASKKDGKAAVRLITLALKFIYEIDVAIIVDIDSCLSVLFQIYINLFSYQLTVSSFPLALTTIDSHLQVKWQFKDKINHGECFLIIRNTVAIFKKSCTDASMLSKIKVNNKILESFVHMTENTHMLTACEVILSLIASSHKAVNQKPPEIPEVCIESFLKMIWNIYNVLKVFKTVKTNLFVCVSEICVFIAKSSLEYSVKVLKDCLPLFIEAVKEASELIKDTCISEANDSQVENESVSMLTGFANLLRYFHLVSLTEELISIGKPLSKLICKIPSDKLNANCKPTFQQLSDLCFTLLVHAFGVDQLDKVVECLTMWLVHNQSASKTAFRLWADIKHNMVCQGKTDHLDDTLWTVLSERKSQMESDWLPCKLSNEEIGILLFEELKTYLVNKSLRGTPVIAATNALLSLGGNCLLLVKALVIGMDIATALADYNDECSKYYIRSQSLMVKLRKEKKNIDPVEFNCWMGNLIYTQLRCQLKSLRKNCETEMVRLSIGPKEPLIAELPESQPDPNDTCDVATKFSNLCLSKQRKLLEDMDAAVRHWGFACSMMKPDSGDYKITMMLVRDAASLMKLYCDEEKQTKAWQILYNMANVVGDVSMIVSAVAEMLNTCHFINEDWLANAKQHLEKPDLSEEVKQTFALNSAMHCLQNNQVSEGLKYLTSLEADIKKHNIQHTKFLITMGMYQKLVNMADYKHTFKLSTSYHYSFYKALGYLLFLEKEKKWGCFWEVCQIQYQLLQVSKMLGETCWSMEQPREARCYLKSQLPLAQKLALPLRTVQLLVLLAWVDLSTGMADDCAVKLGGVEDLLELCGTPVRYGDSEALPTVLNNALLSEPEYLSHAPACHCLPCTTVEYRRLVLETVTLRATFCLAFGNRSHATACFQLANQIQEDLSDSKDQDVLCSCARLWIRSATMMISMDQLEEALSANLKAEQLLPLIMDPNIHQLVVEQHCTIKFAMFQWLQSAPIRSLIVVEDLETISEPQTTTPMKTPDRAKRNVLTTKKKNPLCETNTNVTPITPFTRPVARFKLVSSGEENTPPFSPPKTKTKRKVLPKFVTETPQSIQKFTKSTRKPFSFYHDDESSKNNTVTSTSKPISRPKKADKKSKEEGEKTKKTLFASVSISNEKSDLKLKTGDIGEDDNIIRRSKRANTAVKTYGKSKIPLKKGSKEENTNGGSDAFLFDEMKVAIGCFEGSADSKNASSTKFSSSVCLPKKSSVADLITSLSELKTIEDKDVSEKCDTKGDCDFVDGTPPDLPKKTFLRSKKARSNKV